MKKLNTNVTVHNLDNGESGTFGPGDELPAWAEEAITNPDVWEDVTEEEDIIGGDEEEEEEEEEEDDPLMKRTKDDLLLASIQWDVEGVSENNTKAEISAAIRAAGYEGDGSDLLDEE